MDTLKDSRHLRARPLDPVKTESTIDVADTQKVSNYLEPGVRLSASALRERGLADDPNSLVDCLDRGQSPSGEKILDVFS
ncbi:MAG: hypothetical protein LBT38_09475 [Deltaproteobacteria bacterium]|jgi:hypothetical protein|nr:hypothetical protein [Deltaproteobacteria bacterium]